MRRFWMLGLGFGAGLLGCGGSDTGVTPPPAAVESVAITQASIPTLLVGSSVPLGATARDGQNNALLSRLITWSSSAASIASVSASGIVTGVAPGSAQIRATSDGKFAEIAVTVRPLPWSLTGSLATGRTLLTLTVLANGSVLAVGGQVLGVPFETIRTSELYDPAAGTWASTGSLTTGRANHIAIRLQNGKVLVAGGYMLQPSTRLASAELYDPATGTWSATGSMLEARDLAAAALLPDGRVLVTGGSATGTNLDALATTEIYNPASGTWSRAANMSVARGGHTATALSNGRIVVVGGASGTYGAPTLHTSAEVFDPATAAWTATGGVSIGRGFHRSVALTNGRMLMTGGSDFVSSVFASTDIYDVSTGVWTASTPLVTGRISHSATVLATGNALIAGGGAASVLASAELFDVTGGRWTSAGDMRIPRSNHAAALLLNGKVLVVGGQGVGASTSAEIYDPG
jgi:Bacterial Ig-like domain (group 2)/Kelch motif/Galactose oxidase, central domain